jgi:hypothetical protein
MEPKTVTKPRTVTETVTVTETITETTAITETVANETTGCEGTTRCEEIKRCEETTDSGETTGCEETTDSGETTGSMPLKTVAIVSPRDCLNENRKICAIPNKAVGYVALGQKEPEKPSIPRRLLVYSVLGLLAMLVIYGGIYLWRWTSTS